MKRRLAVPLWLESAAASLLALAASSAATILFFQFDDARVMARFNAEVLAERVGTAAAAILKAPDSLRPELLAAFSRPSRRLTIEPQPIVDGAAARDAAVEARIAALLPAVSPDGIRVHQIGPEEASLRPPEAQPQPGAPAPLRENVLVSVDAGAAGWLNVRYSTPPSRERFWPALLSGAVAITVMIMATLWTVARFARPLQRLAEGASALRRGEPPPEMPEEGPEAVRAAARSFNAMSRRLMSTLESQRAMMVAVAHDLRTPIASLRLRAEFVKDEEARRRLLQTLDEMQAMTEAVLDAVRADRTGETTRAVDLTALAESLCVDMAEIGGDVSFAPNRVVRCVCRTNEVRRALRNLIENALRYGKRARVSIESDEETATLHVDDDGPGIPPSQLERVFEPFARLEESRSPETGGFGLGLAIARLIARGHGGDVSLANRAGGGLRATLTLPIEA
jgi:signal transduction histidine kinase